MMPAAEVAFNTEALAVPRTSAAAVVIEAKLSAVTFRFNALLLFVLVPVTERLLLLEVSKTESALRLMETLLSSAVELIVVALVETLRVPVPVASRANASLLEVTETLLALRTSETSSAVVVTVEAEPDRAMLPLPDVAVSEELLTDPSMSAATVVTEADGSAVAFRVSVLAESVLVPLTVRLLLVDVSDTVLALTVIETSLSAAVVLIVDASVDTVNNPVPDDWTVKLLPVAVRVTSSALSSRLVLPAVVSTVAAEVDRLMSPVDELAVREVPVTLPNISAAAVDTLVLAAETLRVRVPLALAVVP
jgi:hypothetical protein